MTERRMPMHLAVLVGASAAAYALSLAGMTALQSATDQALIDARAPRADLAARLTAEHDRLQAQVDRSTAAYADSAARFDAVAAGIESLDGSLDRYAGRMASVTGAARALPGHVSLPTVSRAPTTARAKPATSSTTGASGKP